MAERPTDDTIALVAFLMGWDWYVADEIRHGIPKLGFSKPSLQWVVARLRAMAQESAPRFEARLSCFGNCEYRVTHWAETGLSNNWRGFYTAPYVQLLKDGLR